MYVRIFGKYNKIIVGVLFINVNNIILFIKICGLLANQLLIKYITFLDVNEHIRTTQ